MKQRHTRGLFDLLDLRHPQVRWLTPLVVAASCCLGTATSGLAQEVVPAAAQETPQPPPIRPLQATEIADSAVAARAVLRNASRTVDATTDLAEISEGLAGSSDRVTVLERDSRERMQTDGPGFALEQTERSWQRVADQLGAWLRRLSSNAADVGSALDRIDAEKQLWEMTRDSIRAGDVPAEVTREIRQTLAAVDSVQGLVRAARDSVLKLQAAVSEQKTRADQNLADQREEIARRRGRLLSIDSSPLWKVFDRPDEDRSLSERNAATLQLNYVSVRWYLEERKGELLGSLAFLLALIATLVRLRGVAETQLDQDDSLRVVAGFFDRPVAAGFFIASLIGYMAQPSAPRAWKALLGLVALAAVLRLLPRILTKSTRSWGYVAAALFFLQQTVVLSEFGTPENRLALLLLSVVGLAACLRFMSSPVLTQTTVSKRWALAIGAAVRLSAIAFAVGTIANIVGSAGFATIVTTGTVHLAFAAIAFWVAVVVVLAAVRIGTRTKTAARLGIAPPTAGTVERVARHLVVSLAWIGFAATTLSGFGVLEPVITALTRVFGAGISVGTFSLSVGDVLVFGLVIWLSLKFSQFVSFVLGTDLLPLMHLRHGLQAAIIQLTRYAVILIGILVAFSAAGVEIDRLTVLFGAVGVGVGFGLQNVVNNLASGLIVLFGQGINFGDEVQFDQFSGVVRDIGLLQSTVRTYHGADVLVPNATLVSSTVVNWTRELADLRRVDVPVGVAYGTDPKTVIDLLEGMATEHPQVVKKPAPKVIFLGFGENSMNFQLNVWFPVDQWYGASSEVRVAASDALSSAGIEIAVPQRDLRLRSVDEEVSIEVSSHKDSSPERGPVREPL
jgi:small-conductance mechanosensitive channel